MAREGGWTQCSPGLPDSREAWGDTEMRPGDAPGTKLAPKPGRFSVPLVQTLLVLGRRPSATTSSTEMVGERCCVCSAERFGLEKLHFWAQERSGLAAGCGCCAGGEVTSFRQAPCAAGSNAAHKGEPAPRENPPGSTCSGQKKKKSQKKTPTLPHSTSPGTPSPAHCP